jgi:DNA-binding NtrC family response regulator/putative methionine-R-sulfoxide reductase with GAF domain
MAVLLFSTGKDRQDYYTLDAAEACVGRDAACDIALADASVSRRHALIVRRGGAFEIEDLGSKNGVFVDGQAVTRGRLTNGAAVRFGNVEAKFLEQFSEEVSLAGVADDATRLFARAELSPHLRKLQRLYELAEEAGRAESEAAIAQTALDIVLREMGCENAYVGFCDESSRSIRSDFHRTAAGRAERFALSRTILAKVLASGRQLLVANAGAETDLRNLASIAAASTKSVLCVPVRAAGRVLGVLYADTRFNVRPFTDDDLAFAGALASLLGAIVGNLRLIVGLREANKALQERCDGIKLIGGARIAAVREQLRKFAGKGAATVLILGPSGSGKELAARLIHRQSNRAEKPFLDVNCAAFPKDLIESELFGHVKGAFTSATGDRRGLFQLANGGCLFLDEIAEMPHDLQGKLLRVLETGEFRPVGADRTVKVDVRIIAATNKDLRELAKKGGFREDLYYRLNVLTVTIPPLADRREDIPELCAHFLTALCGRIDTRARGLSPAALECLQRHDWPGNVRELRNVIERALYICESETIQPEHLVGLVDDEAYDDASAEAAEPVEGGRLEREIEELERVRLREALERHHWNRSRAAAELGIARKTLFAKLKKYEL